MGCGSPPLIFGAWGYVDDVTPHLAWQHLPDIFLAYITYYSYSGIRNLRS